jgi:hypothetical protein
LYKYLESVNNTTLCLFISGQYQLDLSIANRNTTKILLYQTKTVKR